ncbi:hypothetical protein ANCCAN_09991 [Ancylostoma caninum]|uniref:Uncharacterized protein n=1 Tax=Ancylostoma caninum TaxID=29170 RepID=A0A368GI50_ANCCA|nr:hypothetical protein ANCCAN_09991 [Ancylostoma caninum]
MVCVQSQTGSKCMPVDPANNCETMRCNVGSTCEYQDTECIPDKACFAEPMCKGGGPQKPFPEENPDTVNNNYGPGTQSDVPKGGESASPHSKGAAQPPCLAKCSANERCVLSSDDSSCYNPPCPPVPTCVKIYIQPPRPVGKR